jgi:hypothetical protein
MKSVVADYRYRILCLRIVPVTGSPIYLTDHPRDLVMSGHTYLSTAGYQFTGQSATAGFSPASVDIEGHCRGLRTVARRRRQRPVRRGALLRLRDVLGSARRGPGTRRRRHLRQGDPARPPLPDRRRVADRRAEPDRWPDLRRAVPEAVLRHRIRRLRRVAGGQHRHRHLDQCDQCVGVHRVRANGSGRHFWRGHDPIHQRAECRAESAGDQEFCGWGDHHLRAVLLPAGGRQRLQHGARLPQAPVRLPGRWNGSGIVSNVANFGGFPWIPTGSTYAQVGQGG